jgi:hypothetical protein
VLTTPSRNVRPHTRKYLRTRSRLAEGSSYVVRFTVLISLAAKGLHVGVESAHWSFQVWTGVLAQPWSCTVRRHCIIDSSCFPVEQVLLSGWEARLKYLPPQAAVWPVPAFRVPPSGCNRPPVPLESLNMVGGTPGWPAPPSSMDGMGWDGRIDTCRHLGGQKLKGIPISPP